jgi:hypothetical protein
MDSTALAIYLKGQGEEIELVYADTGAELPEALWFAPRVAHTLGCKLTVVNSVTFFQRLVGCGFMLPSFRVRWCTRELKINALPKGLAVGICADEAHRMPHGHRPLVDAGIGKKDARQLCESRGLVNPCYSWRTSCSCFCCPFQRKSDWLGLNREHPDLFALAEEWERMSTLQFEAGYRWNRSFALSELRTADDAQMELWPECREEACLICTT